MTRFNYKKMAKVAVIGLILAGAVLATQADAHAWICFWTNPCFPYGYCPVCG